MMYNCRAKLRIYLLGPSNLVFCNIVVPVQTGVHSVITYVLLKEFFAHEKCQNAKGLSRFTSSTFEAISDSKFSEIQLNDSSDLSKRLIIIFTFEKQSNTLKLCLSVVCMSSNRFITGMQ